MEKFDKNNSLILMTPQNFLSFYNMIYELDEEISKVKDIASILCIMFMILGILDNLISIYAFLHKNLIDNSFNWYLLVLTVFKLVFCLTLFIDYIFKKIYHKHVFLHDLNKYATITIDFIIHTSDSCIALLTVFLSLDRLYSIKYPMKLKNFITNLHAKALVSVAIVTLILFIILNTILCEQSDLSKPYVLYCTIAAPTLINTIPLVSILILNVLLLKETIKKYYQKRDSIFVSLHKNSDLQPKTSVTPLLDHSAARRRSTLKDQDMRRKSTAKKSIQLDINGENITRKSKERLKSHYWVTIILDVWSFLTSTPYYILNSHFLLFHLNVLSIEKIIILQIVSSVLFNSNYCINFFIYLGFYGEFRDIIISIFTKFIDKRRCSLGFV